MKNFYKYSVIILFIIFIFGSCNEDLEDYLPTHADLREQIHLKFNFSFGGDWSLYEAEKVDFINVLIDKDIFYNENEQINFIEKINYVNDANSKRIPSLVYFNDKSYFIFKPKNKEETYLRTIDTHFTRSIDNKKYSPENTILDYEQKLNFKTINELTLTYDMNTTPVYNFTAKINSGTAIVTQDSNKLYNFDVNWEYVKTSSYPIDKSINIAVMADGYRLDEMEYFRKYVRDAFKTPSNSNYIKNNTQTTPHNHADNDFFYRHWDKINVVMYETISPHSGIDTVSGKNEKMNFFQLNTDRTFLYQVEGTGNFERMRKVINDTNKNKGNELQLKNIDVFIILVNNENIGAYTFSYDLEINYRNKQPVSPVIIQAPAIWTDVEDKNFHEGVYGEKGGVNTNAIAHELGHAIARLQDEYYKSVGNRKVYEIHYRNISENGHPNLKWQRLLMVNSEYYISPNNSQHSNHYKLTNFSWPYFKNRDTPYFIPTYNSIMNGEFFTEKYQYGPINTYFMEGSFRVRMSINDIKPQDPKYNGKTGYEWEGYKFEDFELCWPPSLFDYGE